MLDRGLTLTWHAVRRQLAAMPHELYLVRLIHAVTKRPFPGERLWTAAQLLHLATLRFLRIRNREGCDVYIQPYDRGSKRRLHPDRPGPRRTDGSHTHAGQWARTLCRAPDQPRSFASLGACQCHSTGTGGRYRHRPAVGAGLWRRRGQRRLAALGQTRRFHQSETRTACVWRQRPLGESRV